MTFDFFNPSHLAFGSKLTKAFNQLNRVCNEAEKNLDDLFRIYETYKQFINRNYPCPFPSRGDAPCRTNELFDVINDENIVKDLSITEEGKFHCAINLFKRNTNRLTIAEGETNLKKGYAFVRSSISNINPNREIQFVENYSQGSGNFLFSYRIDSDNNINISEGAYDYFLPSSFDHITGMTNGESVTTGYTAEDYECIVCVGYARWGGNGEYTDGSPLGGTSCLSVNINEKNVAYITGWQCRQYIVVYLKPGDVLTGSFHHAFKVKYTENIVPAPTPISGLVLSGNVVGATGTSSSIINKTIAISDEDIIKFNTEDEEVQVLSPGVLSHSAGYWDASYTNFLQLYVYRGIKPGDTISFEVKGLDSAAAGMLQFYNPNSGASIGDAIDVYADSFTSVSQTVQYNSDFLWLYIRPWSTYFGTYDTTYIFKNFSITRGE